MTPKKLFTLLSQQSVELRPGQKILPEKAFATVVDSQELLEKVQLDAVEYRKKIALEGEKGREVAKQEGFENGLQTWAKEVFQLETEAEKLRGEYEGLIAKVAVKAAQTVIGKELEEKPEIFASIVSHTLRAVTQHKRIVIYCSRHDHEVLEKQKPKLKALFEQLEILAIQVKAELPQGGYIIETERGIINNSDIQKMWQTLESVFASQLLGKEQRV